MIRSCAILALGLAAFLCAGVRGEEATPEPLGYRTDNYRAPTPATLAGARVVTTAQVETLWQDKAAIFVDVIPRAPPPPHMSPGAIVRGRPGSDIATRVLVPGTR